MNFRRIRDEKTGGEIIETALRGEPLLRVPLLNKGLGFTAEERAELGLVGLLPPRTLTLEEDAALAYEQYRGKESDLERHTFLTSLQDRNETLFYGLMLRHLAEMTPIVYTPTVGAAVEHFSHRFRRARGLFISAPDKQRVGQILDSHPLADLTEAIVVTDSEAILGIGDQGAGGMGIPIGKLALYAICGGLAPETTLPIALDVGTDNQELLDDPLYLGWRHPRLRGREYDEFLEAFVAAVHKRWPRVLLQFEDFAAVNARALLERYRDRLCTFNDDIQGTGAVTLASLIAAAGVSGTPLEKHQVVILGAGAGGTGIADAIVTGMVERGATAEQAVRNIWLVGRQGLILSNMHDPKYPYRRKYAQPPERIKDWQLKEGPITLHDVMLNLKPQALIGTSAQRGSFSEEVVREMARHVERPILFPLSNPITKAEAVPADLVAWTEGRALIATGSPFADVEHGGRAIRISQCNNSFIFPGVALGVLACGARRVTDEMFAAAARALAECSPARTIPDAPLLPPMTEVREVSRKVAIAVSAAAERSGAAERTTPEEVEQRVARRMWTPQYARVRLARE